MSEKKKVKIIFDPAFFEAFTGTQEELEQVMTEIRQAFENKTPEELKALSTPVEIDELTDSEEDKILKSLYNKTYTPPTLQ